MDMLQFKPRMAADSEAVAMRGRLRMGVESIPRSMSYAAVGFAAALGTGVHNSPRQGGGRITAGWTLPGLLQAGRRPTENDSHA